MKPLVSLKPALNSCILLFLTSAYFLLGTYFSTTEFTTRDVRIVFGVVFAMVFVQAIVITAAYAISHKPWILYGLTALFLVINAFTLNLVLVAEFVNLGAWALVAALVGLLIAFTLAKLVDESWPLRWIVFSVNLLAMLALSLTHNAGEAAVATSDASETTVSPKIRKVDFTTKPNVYLVGFESMQPAAVLSKYLKLDNPPHAEAFDRNNFRRFRNLFTEAQPTQRSFNSLLSLDYNYYRTVDKMDTHLFQGFNPSPLVQIFKHNGYETSTLFSNGFFGEGKGPYIDHYMINEEFSVCRFMENYELNYAFFGVCKLRGSKLWRVKKRAKGEPIDFLLAYMEEVSVRQAPQLLVAHISPLTHLSKKTFGGTQAEVDAFRDRYRELSAKAGENLARLATFIRESDPYAILYVFGDHGIFLSGTLRFTGNEIFIIQDRYAIQGGIYPKDACASTFAAPVSSGYITSPEVVRLIIKCLAGGEDAFNPSYRHTIRFGKVKCEEYLYE